MTLGLLSSISSYPSPFPRHAGFNPPPGTMRLRTDTQECPSTLRVAKKLRAHCKKLLAESPGYFSQRRKKGESLGLCMAFAGYATEYASQRACDSAKIALKTARIHAKKARSR